MYGKLYGMDQMTDSFDIDAITFSLCLFETKKTFKQKRVKIVCNNVIKQKHQLFLLLGDITLCTLCHTYKWVGYSFSHRHSPTEMDNGCIKVLFFLDQNKGTYVNLTRLFGLINTNKHIKIAKNVSHLIEFITLPLHRILV